MNPLTEYRGAISWWFEYNPDWEKASVPYSGRIWNKLWKGNWRIDKMKN